MNIFLYYSTYLIFFGFLYYFKIISYNPFIYLLLALFVSIFLVIYLIYHNVSNYQLLKYIILNSPKLLLLLLIDRKNLFNGFIFYTIMMLIYLIFFHNIYDIYYNKTVLKLLNNDF